MSCLESTRIQDFLDGELSAAEARAFRAHLEGCAECAAGMASFRRVFAALAGQPLEIPAPALTERVLAAVLPSRRRLRRRLAALGWGYAASLAVALAAIGILARLPGPRHLFESASGEASRRLLEGGVFVLNAVTGAVLRLAEGWGLAVVAMARLAPITKALGTFIAQPAVTLTLWASAMGCVALLMWMRPRTRTSGRGVRHVGVLGF
jgi:predicted anti-sigma-YlaC factor YlaD